MYEIFKNSSFCQRHIGLAVVVVLKAASLCHYLYLPLVLAVLVVCCLTTRFKPNTIASTKVICNNLMILRRKYRGIWCL